MSTAKTDAIPTHLGLILDGNRRWARSQGLSLLEGHRRGYQNLITIGKVALKRGVKYVSAFTFSTENWSRAKHEVDYLMRLALMVATEEVKKIHKDNIRVIYLGTDDRVDPKLLKAIRAAEELTANNTGGTLALCFNYGGQTEIAEAVAKMIDDGVKAEEVTPEKISQYHYAPDVPPVDLIIRTSGEQRLSNFMLWRAAYSELMFVPKHWPEFTEADLEAALDEYAIRNRRFGR